MILTEIFSKKNVTQKKQKCNWRIGIFIRIIATKTATNYKNEPLHFQKKETIVTQTHVKLGWLIPERSDRVPSYIHLAAADIILPWQPFCRGKQSGHLRYVKSYCPEWSIR